MMKKFFKLTCVLISGVCIAPRNPREQFNTDHAFAQNAQLQQNPDHVGEQQNTFTPQGNTVPQQANPPAQTNPQWYPGGYTDASGVYHPPQSSSRQ